MPNDTPDPELRPVITRRSFATSRTIIALMMREMSTTYGKTWGGYVWAILEPVAGIVLLTLVFAVVLRNPPLGTNFQIFYATGIIPFMFYGELSTKMSQAVGFSKQLLFYPAVTFMDAVLARIFINVLTQFLVGYIIFVTILLVWDTRTAPEITEIALAYAMVIALSVGIGTLNCFLFAWFPIWQKVWGILNRPLFIISGVFFIYDSIPDPWRDYLWWNPLVHVIGQMRHGFYHSYAADYVSPTYVFAISGITFLAGAMLLYRYNRDIVNER